MKYCVLTANIGNKDQVIFNDDYLSGDLDFFYYTDNLEIQHNKWSIKKIPIFSNIDEYKDRRNAKIIKTMGFLFEPNYTHYLWMDANLIFKKSIFQFINDNIDNDTDLYVFRHGLRNNILDEAKELLYYNLDDPNLIKKQIQKYTKDNMNYFLFEMPCFIYKNTENVRNFLFSWYEQIAKYSSRDQLSFPYCLSFHNLKVKFFEGTVYNNDYFYKNGHIK